MFSWVKEIILGFAHEGPWESKVTESGDENPVKAEEEIEDQILSTQEHRPHSFTIMPGHFHQRKVQRQTWPPRRVNFSSVKEIIWGFAHEGPWSKVRRPSCSPDWFFAHERPWESKVTESGDENPVKAEEGTKAIMLTRLVFRSRTSMGIKENKENTNRSGKMELVDDLTPISLPQDAGLSLSSFLGLQKNMVLFSKTAVPIVLTFCTDPDSDAALTYNRKLATLLLRKMRKYVDEDFTFAFGVVGEDDTESLLDRVKTLRERSTRFALRRYLIMTPEKCESLTRGLVSMLSEMKL